MTIEYEDPIGIRLSTDFPPVVKVGLPMLIEYHVDAVDDESPRFAT